MKIPLAANMQRDLSHLQHKQMVDWAIFLGGYQWRIYYFRGFLLHYSKLLRKINNLFSAHFMLWMLSNKVASPLVSISALDLIEIISLCYLIIHSIIPKILRSHDLCFKCLPRKSIYGDLNPCILLSITLKLFRFHSLLQQLESHLFKHKQVYGFF